jgi:dipeptidyl-peptidase 4
MTLRLLLPFLITILPLTHLCAQGTIADYERASGLGRLVQGKVLNARPQVHWLGDGHRFIYLKQLPQGEKEVLLVDARDGNRQPAFDHDKLAAVLKEELKRDINPKRLPFDAIDVNDAGTTYYFRLDTTDWRYHQDSNKLEKGGIPRPAPPQRGRGAQGRRPQARAESPDGKWRAFTKENNVFLRNTDTKEEHQLTKDGTADETYNEVFYWSPNSKKLIIHKVQKGQEHKVYLIESSPRDQVQPKHHEMNYLKPGDKLPISRPHLVDVASRKLQPIASELFANPYQITEHRWDENSSRFFFLYNQRGHQLLRLVAVDAESGKASTIFEELSKTFVNYSGKFHLTWLMGMSELIWMSERDGWNHLYLLDGKTGSVKHQLTKGNWVVRGVVKVDEDKRQIWFRAGGFYSEQDPYYQHLGRVNFDGTGLTILTTADGTHTTEFSPKGDYLVDTYSRADAPPITEIRSATDGKKLFDLEKADITALQAAGWKPPQRFVAKGRDGSTDIYGIIWRPYRYDASKKYPVIELIYAGPQDSFVPKDFRPLHRVQSIVELGFIVVQIDGMGTSNRSKAFHDVCWKNLGDAGFPDRIAWMKAAADSHPEMDLTRVGIFGGSAGGQNSLRGMLMYPDFYKVCVSDCGCHDNRMDKIWWNEQWMGWPIGKHYDEQSNVTQAHRLQGKLLLTVGELDRNVDPASTMQVVNALIRANKDFEMIVVPGGGHGVGETPYMARRRQDFFVRHLLGVEPRSK